MVHFREGNILGHPTYLLSLQLDFFAKLLNFHLQLFLFWQIFDVKGRHFRPRLGAGAAVEVGRLDVPQTRARPELTTLPAHPTSAGGDSLPQRPDDFPSRQPCLASQDLKTPALFLGSPQPQEACPREPGEG